MQTPASIKGHPLHPILVTFPIALWIFSLAADVIYFGRLSSGPWRDIAFYTMAGGIAGAVLAAVPGLVDLLSITDSTLRRIGILHMVLNVIVLAIFCVNWALRFGRSSTPLGLFILSIIGVVLMFVAGWLGGSMVHHYRMSVEEPGGRRGPLPAT